MPVAASQTRAVPSPEAVTMRAPSGENARSTRRPRGLAGRRFPPGRRVPDRAVWSQEAVTMRAPSGENAALVTAPSWPRRTANSEPSPRPRPAPCCPRRCDDAAAVGREAGARNRALVAAQRRDLVALRRVPDARGLIDRRGDYAAAVGRERCDRYTVLAAQRHDLPSRRGIPNARGLVVRRGDYAPAVGRERCRSDYIRVAAQQHDLKARRRVPDPRSPIR